MNWMVRFVLLAALVVVIDLIAFSNRSDTIRLKEISSKDRVPAKMGILLVDADSFEKMYYNNEVIRSWQEMRDPLDRDDWTITSKVVSVRSPAGATIYWQWRTAQYKKTQDKLKFDLVNDK